MTVREAITLRRSGVVMTWDGFNYWSAPNGADLIPPHDVNADEWCADFPFIGSEMTNQMHGTREKCIEFLDAQMLIAQAALLPPGGFVVVPDEATVAKIADALAVGVMEAQDMEIMARNHERRLRHARAVLAALVEPKP